MEKKTNTEIAKILLEIISKDLSYSGYKSLLGNFKQYYWIEKPNTEVALYSNTKQPIPALFEIIDNHEDSYTQLMLDMNPSFSIGINSLEDVLLYSSKWSGVPTDSHYNGIIHNEKSPYLAWDKNRKTWVIFSAFNSSKNTRNITTIDNARGLSTEEYHQAFHEKYGDSNKSNENYFRGKLGLGEASVLPHCVAKLSATRKHSHYDSQDNEMVLGYSMLVQDSNLIYELIGKETDKPCVLEMVNEIGQPITATSQDLIHLFNVDGIKFQEANSWSYEIDKTSQNPKPKIFKEGFMNKMVDFELPKSYLDQDQISTYPENHFTQVLNSSYAYANHPVVICEADPNTRKNNNTASNVHVKPFRYSHKAFKHDFQSKHEILLSFTCRLGEIEDFQIPIIVYYFSKEDSEKLKSNQKGIFLLSSGGRITRLRKSNSVHSVIQSISPDQATREACKRILILVDLSQLPRRWNSILFNADKTTIDHHSSYCKSILNQIENAILSPNNEHFANICSEEQSHLNKKRVTDANIEAVKGNLLTLIRSALPLSKNGDCINGKGSGTKIITRNPKLPPVNLKLFPTYITIDKDTKDAHINSKRAYIQFQTDGEEKCFYKHKNLHDREKIKITYKGINITDTISSSHGVLKVAFALSIIQKTETLNIGDQLELDFYVESQCGLKSEGKFRVNVIESSSSPNKPKSSSNPPHLAEIKKQCRDFPTPSYEFLSTKDYNKRVASFFDDEQFTEALANQYPNTSTNQYIKNNPLCFIVKDGLDHSLALLNKELLPTIIIDNQINNVAFQEEILMSSMDVCMNKDVFLINNNRLRCIIQKSISKPLMTKPIKATRKISQPKNKLLTKS